MNLRDAVKNLHGLGFPIYRGGLPGYYVLDVTQALPKTRRDLIVFLEAIRVLDKARAAGEITYHVEGHGSPVYVCIKPDLFKKLFYDIEHLTLEFYRRLTSGLEYTNDAGEHYIVSRRSGLIKKVEREGGDDALA